MAETVEVADSPLAKDIATIESEHSSTDGTEEEREQGKVEGNYNEEEPKEEEATSNDNNVATAAELAEDSEEDSDSVNAREIVDGIKIVSEPIALDASSSDSENDEVRNTKRPKWVRDDDALECIQCKRKFGLLLRRHHCRGCGRVFCGKCCNETALLPIDFDYKYPQRVCNVTCAKKFWPFSSRVVETSLGEVEYIRFGTGKNVLVGIHGGLGTASQGALLFYTLWSDPKLLDSFTFVFPSRSGFGRTPLTEANKSITSQADTIVSLLSILNITSRVIVATASAGGPIALTLATRHANRVKGLILISAVTGRYWPLQARGKMEQEGKGKEAKGLAGRVVAGWAQSFGFWSFAQMAKLAPDSSMNEFLKETTTWTEEDRERRIKEATKEQVWFFQALVFGLYPFSKVALGAENEAKLLADLPMTVDWEHKVLLGKPLNYTSEEEESEKTTNTKEEEQDADGLPPWDQISVPTLIIHGKDDGDVDPLHAQFLANRINKKFVQLELLEGTGHLIWIGDEVQRVKQLLRDFTNNLQDSK